MPVFRVGGMTARLCISRLLYMGGNVSYLLRIFRSFQNELLIDKLSEEDCSPESIGIYISIYILSVWFDGILLQVNWLFAYYPLINSNSALHVVVWLLVVWCRTVWNVSTEVVNCIYIHLVDAVTED